MRAVAGSNATMTRALQRLLCLGEALPYDTRHTFWIEPGDTVQSNSTTRLLSPRYHEPWERHDLLTIPWTTALHSGAFFSRPRISIHGILGKRARDFFLIEHISAALLTAFLVFVFVRWGLGHMTIVGARAFWRETHSRRYSCKAKGDGGYSEKVERPARLVHDMYGVFCLVAVGSGYHGVVWGWEVYGRTLVSGFGDLVAD